MMKLKRIGVVSFAKTVAVAYALIGLLYGAFLSLFALVGMGAMLAEELGGAAGISALFGVGAIVLFPIMFGVMGFIGGLIGGFFYNLALKYSGGLEMEFEKSTIAG